MGKKSAGILLYRINKVLEVFLIHPGGPFFKNRDAGAWSIPKGEFTDEDPLACARREFEEETGLPIDGNFMPLLPITQKGGKTVYCWAVEGDIDEHHIGSNTFQIEWPPKSGKLQAFPEVDKAGWFNVSEAKQNVNRSQFSFIEQLIDKLE